MVVVVTEKNAIKLFFVNNCGRVDSVHPFLSAIAIADPLKTNRNLNV
jgi:hypothetical protein